MSTNNVNVILELANYTTGAQLADALAEYQLLSEKGAANGYVGVNSNRSAILGTPTPVSSVMATTLAAKVQGAPNTLTQLAIVGDKGLNSATGFIGFYNTNIGNPTTNEIASMYAFIGADGQSSLGFKIFDKVAGGQVNHGLVLNSDGTLSFDGPATFDLKINRQAGMAYVLAAADRGGLIEMNNANSNVVTIPKNTTVALPVGTQIVCVQLGVGQTSFASASGVTIISDTNKLKIATRGAAVTAYKSDVDTWVLMGNLSD